MILLASRLDKDRHGKHTDKGKMEEDRTEGEQGGVRGCKVLGGAGTR